MTRVHKPLSNALAALLVAVLAACGGGGGDAPPAPNATLDISAANRDSVAHASAAGVLSSSPTAAVPLAAAPDRRQALGSSGALRTVRSGRLLAALLQPLRSPAAPALIGAREQAQAVIGPVVEACALSGTVSVRIDDRDNNAVPSVGDVLTITFAQCRDSANETLNGSASASYTQISTAPIAVHARLTTTQLSAVTANHTLTLNGTLLLEFAQASATVATIRLTAEGAVTVAVSTPLPFSDTVTLQNGYTQLDRYDAAALPPPGSSLPGRSESSVQGSLHSARAGGIVEVATLPGAPFVTYDADAYPRAGVLQVKGRNGTLLLTAVSAASVRLDLDADNNGSFESSETVGWDWLL